MYWSRLARYGTESAASWFISCSYSARFQQWWCYCDGGTMALPACNVRQIYERGGMLASPLLGTVASLYCLPSRTWLDMSPVQKRNFWLQILPKVEMSLHKWCVAHSCAAFVRIGIYAPAIMRPTKFALKYTKQPCSMFRVWAFSRARLVWFSVFRWKYFP